MKKCKECNGVVGQKEADIIPGVNFICECMSDNDVTATVDDNYTPGMSRVVLYLSVNQEALIKFGNLAKLNNKTVDEYMDEAIKEKIEREKI